MNVSKKYTKVAKEYEAKNYEAALNLLYKMRSNEKDFYYLEAAIFCGLKNYLKEYLALKNLMPLLSRSLPEDKKDYDHLSYRLGRCYSQLGLIDESLKSFRHVINTMKYSEMSYDSIDNLHFIINAKENASAVDFQAIYDEYRNFFAVEAFPKQVYHHDKIRIGFLSADFYLHPVMNWAFTLLTKLDKNLFKTHYYSNGKTYDQITKRFSSGADSWRDISDLTDETAAKLIRDDEIDILFDLSGHTVGNRLRVAAYRPASVQISGVGYMNSTGLDCFDYFMTDAYCLGDSAPYFTESFIVLPHTHVRYTPFDVTTNLQPAIEPPCLKKDYVTFGCFNQYRKITDSMLTVWKKILDAVPNSHLLLKHKLYALDGGKEFVSKRLKHFGFDLSRVEMRGYSSNHLVEYGNVDIALDTFPYTGGVTTCEALYMGVPVVSLYGYRHGTRFGLSILSNVGLEELAVDSYDDYVQRAVMLAGDWELLTLLRKNLRTMFEKSPLMNSASYIREVEQAFIEVLDAERSRQ